MDDSKKHESKTQEAPRQQAQVPPPDGDDAMNAAVYKAERDNAKAQAERERAAGR